jgi:peptide/nickel transport system ATP-binding protein
MTGDALFEVRDLRKEYRARQESLLKQLFGDQQSLKAVDGVDFDLSEGEFVGLAGQSGCGKSTLGELLVRLREPTDGAIRYRGDDVTEMSRSELTSFRQNCQIIFQNPFEALNPRFPVARLVSEPLSIHDIGDPEVQDARTAEALEDAGLAPPEDYLDRLPSELSGGERQRVAIAQALVLDPEFIVADEPVSMLDVSVRTGILHLFEELRETRDLSMLYISHDLSTISYLTDRTMIMYLGKLVENGPTEEVIHDPSHPYTESLLEAVPTPDPDTERAGTEIEDEPPDPVDIPSGCRFHPTCPYATEECRASDPPLDEFESGDHRAACYHPDQVSQPAPEIEADVDVDS